jgi:tRNA1(Val) A37 N6-methylase TrmN6
MLPEPSREPAPRALTPELTDDAVLGGRLRLLQPRRGHRVGHDAILLAAATPAGELAVDLGAGVGAAGLAVAWRCPGTKVRLVEIDPFLATLCGENAARNGFGARASALALDVLGAPAAFAAAGLEAGSADRVLMNPPFNDPGRLQASPDPGRRSAHMASADTLTGFIATAERLLREGGVLTLIQRADALADVLTALEGRFGDVAALPVHPRRDAAAIRILVRAVKNGSDSRSKGRQAPLALLPGLVLNDDDGKPTDAAELVLRAGHELALARFG